MVMKYLYSNYRVKTRSLALAFKVQTCGTSHHALLFELGSAADWYEDRVAGSLVRDCGALSREDDYEFDGAEMTGQDWVVEDEEEYDDSFVPPGGFPTQPESRMCAPANGFVPSGPQNILTDFAEESIPVTRMQAEDPWVRDGNLRLGSPAGSVGIDGSSGLFWRIVKRAARGDECPAGHLQPAHLGRDRGCSGGSRSYACGRNADFEHHA